MDQLIKTLIQNMIEGNSEQAAVALNECAIAIHQTDIPDDFFASFSQTERKGIIAGYLTAAGRDLLA